MSGMDTRSMSKLMGITSLNDPGTHQDGSICPSPGDENVIDTLYEQEEEAMRRDGLAEELKKKNRGRSGGRDQDRGARIGQLRDPATRNWE